MSREFEAQMKDVLSGTWNHQNAMLVREHTPQILQEVGLHDLPMLYTARHLLAALGDDRAALHTHYIMPEVMERLPELLEDPILIADSDHRPDLVMILTGEKDQIGRPLVAAVSTGGRGTLGGRSVGCNFITSVYGINGFDNWLSRMITQSDVLYIDKVALSEHLHPAYLEAMFPGDMSLHIRQSHNVQDFDLTADDAPARYFIDMDGTLAQFHAEENYLERMTEDGFFENLRPYEQTILKLKDYIKAHPDSEFFVLSGLTADAPDCEGQKNRWLDNYLPEIDRAHRIYTDNGDDKSLYIPGGVHARDILIDDYNKNLEDWQSAGGTAVKFVNPVNDRGLRGKRWEGERIRYNSPQDISAVLGRLSANRSSKDVLRSELQKKVSEIALSFREDPSKIVEFLDFATRFRHYSPKNMRLIMAQRPKAQYVAPSKVFMAGLPDRDGNRLISDPIHIRKGEKALYIWKTSFKNQVMVDGKWKGLQELTAGERDLYKAGSLQTRQTTNYVLVPVFDVTQTTLPSEMYPKLLGFGTPSQSAENLVTALSAYAQSELKCPVVTEDFRGAATSVRGSFFPDLNCIKLSSMLTGDGKLSTLIHELGHATLHADAASRADKSTARVELEADMYALMIGQHFGIEVTDSRQAHLAEHYKVWLNELPEESRSNVNADMPVFADVCTRYRETIDTIDEYAERYAAYLRADAEQIEQEPVKQAVAEQPEERLKEAKQPTKQSAEIPERSEQTEDKPTKKWNISI